MEIIAIVVLVIAAWMAVKLAGFVLKAIFFVVVFAALYWLAAPYLGLHLPV
ncbi:MAG: hypothetical protein ABI588_05905 [Arenimonas sp.]